MTEKEKELKAFNHCADSLNALDKKSIVKVFQLLAVHFEIMPFLSSFQQKQEGQNTPVIPETEVLIEVPQSLPQQKVKPTSKKGKSSNSKTPTYLTDYNFMPSDKTSLREFFNRYKTNSNFENNLVFVYYLQEIVHESSITTNHIFSCYRHLGLKIPSFPQTLVDTKKAKGWIETSNSNDIKVTRAGINFLEHSLAKNDE